MEVYKEITNLREKLTFLRKSSNSLGFVPTMGGLHEGHLNLLQQSKDQNAFTICSIFVNPQQFNNSEDLKNYPRPLDKDLELLEKNNCDLVFCPSVSEMFSENSGVKLELGKLGEILEGKFRPGHFNGVALIVSKLFNIIQPDRAYFGEKDLQQLYIIHKLVHDLNYNIEIVNVATAREGSGLAMSSRNERLSGDRRGEASIIYKALEKGRTMILNGNSQSVVVEKINSIISKSMAIEIEYVACVDLKDFTVIEDLSGTMNLAICVAVIMDGIRLIDNVIVRGS